MLFLFGVESVGMRVLKSPDCSFPVSSILANTGGMKGYFGRMALGDLVALYTTSS